MIWNVEVGIAVSIIVSLLLVVRRSSKTRMAILVPTHILILAIVSMLDTNLLLYVGSYTGD